LKYQLWRITKLCFGLLWCEELKEAESGRIFARIHKIHFLNKNYGGSASSVLCWWCEGTQRGESGAKELQKRNSIVAIDPGLLFFFFQFCEIGGLAIVIHKRNLTKVPRNSGAEFRKNIT
jgi:hypothetical protein